MATIRASHARQTLPAQLDRVEAGEEISITRHGKVVAVLVRPDALIARRAPEALDLAARIGERLARARAEAPADPVISADRADELVHELRSARAAR